MKRTIIFITAIVLLSCSGCNTEKKNIQSVNPDGIELHIEPGAHWQEKMKGFIFNANKTPQIAAWIEDNNGNYISTVTVTNRSAKEKWRGSPIEGRPEALPVWYHKIQNNAGEIDTVTAASSKKPVDVQIDNNSLINGNEYNIYLEINQSYDYNDFWTENNSGVNGQPSIIYHAKFIAGKSDSIKLNTIGYGSVDGSDGIINPGLEKITTALLIIKDAYIIVN